MLVITQKVYMYLYFKNFNYSDYQMANLLKFELILLTIREVNYIVHIIYTYKKCQWVETLDTFMPVLQSYSIH